MPGQTLCGELTEWVGDASLLNCCVDDHNEPLDDDFDLRMRVEAEGQWIDPHKGFVTEEEVAELLGVPIRDAEGYVITDEEDGDVEEGSDGTDHAPASTTMSLRHPYIRQYAGTNGDGPDHMARLLEACPHEPYEQVAACSCSRLPLRRSTRYTRGH